MLKHHRPLLIADPDEEYTTFMADVLRLEGYAPKAIYRLSEVKKAIEQQEFELLILTVDLTYPSAKTLCETLKEKPTLPVLFQYTGTEPPKGLDAEHFTWEAKAPSAKPLLGRIERLFSEQDPLRARNQSPLTVGPLVIERERPEIILNNTRIHLTGSEHALIELLAHHINQPVKKDDLYQKALGRNRQPYDRAVDVHISAIRAKLKGQDRIQIKSVRGVGYKLTCDQ